MKNFKFGGVITDGCSLNLAISALACAMAKGKTTQQLTLLSVFFTQLGDTFATIAACNDGENSPNTPSIEGGVNIS